jgi:hypothetical protein
MSYSRLTNGEAERIQALIKECARTIKTSIDILNMGFEEVQPDSPRATNRDQLAREVGFLHQAIETVIVEQDIDEPAMYAAKVAWAVEFAKFSHYQKD